jgi:hypothetical protein
MTHTLVAGGFYLMAKKTTSKTKAARTTPKTKPKKTAAKASKKTKKVTPKAPGARKKKAAAEDVVAKETKTISEKAMKNLITHGKKQGFLSYGEINKALPDDMLSPDQIDDTLMLFSDLGIDIIDEKNEKLAKPKALPATTVSQKNGCLHAGLRLRYRPGQDVLAGDGDGHPSESRRGGGDCQKD